MKQLFAAAILLASLHTAAAGQAPRTPQPGSPERRAILDALRPAVESQVEAGVVFADVHLAVQDGWAYVRAIPYVREEERTDTLSDLRAPCCEPFVHGLLRGEGGSWRLVGLALGGPPAATPQAAWPARYGAPRAIFERDPDTASLEAAMREYIEAFAAKDARRILALLPRTTPLKMTNTLVLEPDVPSTGTATYAEMADGLLKKGDLYTDLFGERDPETGEKVYDYYAERFEGETGRAMWRRYSATVYVSPEQGLDGGLRFASFVRWKKENGRWVVEEIGYPSS